MSGIYPAHKDQLLDWALNGNADAVTIQVQAVSEGYTFDSLHAVIGEILTHGDAVEIANLTNQDGLLDGDTTRLTNLSPLDVVQGIVLFFSWAGGSSLICYIDESINLPFPIIISDTVLDVFWNDDGIYQL